MKIILQFDLDCLGVIAEGAVEDLFDLWWRGLHYLSRLTLSLTHFIDNY